MFHFNCVVSVPVKQYTQPLCKLSHFLCFLCVFLSFPSSLLHCRDEQSLSQNTPSHILPLLMEIHTLLLRITFARVFQ